MRFGAVVSVIIPALNEERSIGAVITAIPEWVDEIIVADNGSTDRTAEIARMLGARVAPANRLGYGSACLAGIAALSDSDVVVFLDGDFSDHPEEMHLLVDPIINGDADLVAGSRVLGAREPGSLTPQARFGNWLACNLIRLFWGARYTDLGPFRAIRASTLRQLQMCDPDYGWMVEMQIKATRAGYRVVEVPVRYRRRIGRSKISGTVKGVIGAGTKILLTIFGFALGLYDGQGGATDERLIIFTRYPEPGKTKTRLISIIIPALNEAPNLMATLVTTRSASTAEVIVVDGGSEDDTVAIAESFGARLLTTQTGRACQMNAGATEASGEVLLFLHADTHLPKDFDAHVHNALADPGVIAGAFMLGLDGTHRSLRFIETMANWRSRKLQMPYGDQAIFMRTEVFHRFGGFPQMPLMEDFELMRRLRKQGRIVIAPVPVISSARRWLKLGVFRTTLINQMIIAAYLAGVAPERIARWYDRQRGALQEAPEVLSGWSQWPKR